MELNYGLVDLTIRLDLGTLEKDDSYSSMTLVHRYSVLVIALLVIGWLSAWRTVTWKCYTPTNQTSTSYIFMRVVFCLSSLPTVVNGSSQQAKIIC